MTISGLDYVVLIVYLFAFIFAGYVISKRMVKSSKDFATAGQGMGFLTVVGSTVATCMGASIIFGNFQLMYSSGLMGFLIGYFWHIGWIFLVLMSGRLRKSGATSIPQFLEMRYSPFVRKVCLIRCFVYGYCLYRPHNSAQRDRCLRRWDCAQPLPVS